jgi:hypothetical protein
LQEKKALTRIARIITNFCRADWGSTRINNVRKPSPERRPEAGFAPTAGEMVLLLSTSTPSRFENRRSQAPKSIDLERREGFWGGFWNPCVGWDREK